MGRNNFQGNPNRKLAKAMGLKANNKANIPVSQGKSTNHNNNVYTPELAMAIVEEVASGALLKNAVRKFDISKEAFTKWCQKYPDLRSAYQVAKVLRTGSFEEEVVEIADDDSRTPADKKLSIDSRFRIMALVNPAKYGESAAKVDARIEIDVNFTGQREEDKNRICVVDEETMIPRVIELPGGTTDKSDAVPASGD